MNLHTKILRKLLDIKVHTQISANDLVLCEFPKSGVTYFSFLLANYLLALDGSDSDVNFFNINMFVQDLHRVPSIDSTIKFNSFSGRLLKTHSCYQFVKYPQKIVLIRNPVNTLLSFHRHLSNSNQNSCPNFNDFIRSQKYGISAWIKFYTIHLCDTNPLGQALFAFEKNISNPTLSIKNFCLLSGIRYCNQSAFKASSKTKIKNMSFLEDTTSRFGYTKVSSRFVGARNYQSSIDLEPAISYIHEQVFNSALTTLIAPTVLESIGLGI